MKRIFALCLCVCLFFAGCTAKKTDNSSSSSKAAATTVSNQPKAETVKLVALGDSITRGCSLQSPETERFSVKVCSQMSGNEVWEDENYGEDGLTSSELLTNLNENRYTALANADVITLMIGANNILGPAEDVFLSLLKSGKNNIENKDDYNMFLAAADGGIAQFKSDLPKIIAMIKTAAPEAKLLLINCYNPFKDADRQLSAGEISFSVSALADEYICKLNDIIKQASEENKLTLVDVHTAFNVCEDHLVNAADNPDTMDPHPNAAGQGVIAETIVRALNDF